MRLTIGKFATGIACALIAPLVFGTPGGPFENQVSNTLTNVGDNDPQDALGFVVGQICPGGLAPGIPGPGGSMGSPAGVLLDRDLSDRCTEIVVASGALSSSTPASSAQLNETQAGLQAFAPEESAALATSQVDAGGTHFAAEVEGNSATIILLAQQDSSASNAIEVSNAFGKVDIDKAGWGTEVPDAKSPPSPPRKMRTTQSMNRIVRSIQTNRRVMVPRVRMR